MNHLYAVHVNHLYAVHVNHLYAVHSFTLPCLSFKQLHRTAVGGVPMLCALPILIVILKFICVHVLQLHVGHYHLAISPQPCCVSQVQATNRHSQRTASLVTPKHTRLALLSSHSCLTPHSPLPTCPRLVTLCRPPTVPQDHLPCPLHPTPLQCPLPHILLQLASDRVTIQLQHQWLLCTLLDSTCRLCHLTAKARAAHSKGHPVSMAQTSIHSPVSSRLSSTVSSDLQQARMALV